MKFWFQDYVGVKMIIESEEVEFLKKKSRDIQFNFR